MARGADGKLNVWPLGIVFMSVLTPLYIILTIMFYVYRRRQPIKARMPRATIAANLSLLGLTFLHGVRIQWNTASECWLAYWMDTWLLAGVGIPYLIRAWILLFRFEMTHLYLTTLSTGESARNLSTRSIRDRRPGPSHWILQHGKSWGTRHFVTNRARIGSVLVLLVPLIGSIEYGISETHTCNLKTPLGYVTIGLFILATGLFFVLGWSLRTVTDGFHVKTELRACAVWTTINLVVYLAQFSMKGYDRFLYVAISGVIFEAGLLTISTGYPLYLALCGRKAVSVEIPPDMKQLENLAGVLSLHQGVISFKEHLAKEFAVENLYFYLAVQVLRDDINNWLKDEKRTEEEGHELCEQAHSTYAEFIPPNATAQVNLPYHIATEVYEEFEKRQKATEVRGAANKLTGQALYDEVKSLHTVFDNATDVAWRMMDGDSFPRYQRGPLYKELLAKVTESSHRQRVLTHVAPDLLDNSPDEQKDGGGVAGAARRTFRGRLSIIANAAASSTLTSAQQVTITNRLQAELTEPGLDVGPVHVRAPSHGDSYAGPLAMA